VNYICDFIASRVIKQQYGSAAKHCIYECISHTSDKNLPSKIRVLFIHGILCTSFEKLHSLEKKKKAIIL
jgi:hypothetical protein